jgi:hypothetical protein
MLNALRGLPRTVWLIGLISLINDSASEMIYPLIPLYLSSVLMAGPKALGIIEGIAEATASLLKLFSGVIVDRTRRTKPWIVFGYGLAGLGRPLIAFVSSWPALLVLRFADRVGKGLRTSPRDALLAISAGPKHRGLAFGLHRAMDNAGAVVGPVAASLLLAVGMSLKEVFLWSILPAALCLALALAIREPHERVPACRQAFQLAAGGHAAAFSNAISSLSPSSPLATPRICSCCCGRGNWGWRRPRYRSCGRRCPWWRWCSRRRFRPCPIAGAGPAADRRLSGLRGVLFSDGRIAHDGLAMFTLFGFTACSWPPRKAWKGPGCRSRPRRPAGYGLRLVQSDCRDHAAPRLRPVRLALPAVLPADGIFLLGLLRRAGGGAPAALGEAGPFAPERGTSSQHAG